MQSPDKYVWNREMQTRILTVFLKFKPQQDRLMDALDPSYFTAQDLFIICKLLKGHIEQYGETPTQPDFEILASEYCARHKLDVFQIHQAISKLYNDTSVSNAEFVADRAVAFARHQAMRKAILESVELLQDDSTESMETIVQSIIKASRVGIKTTDGGLDIVEEATMLELPKNLQNRELYSKVLRIPVGLPSLDITMKGGLSPGELGVIIAPTKVGKSTVLVSFAREALMKGKNVFYFTFELQEEDVAIRMASSLTGVPSRILEDPGNPGLKDYGDKAQALLNNWRATGIPHFVALYNPPGVWTVDHIREYLSSYALRKSVHPQLIIVDYGDLLTTKKFAKADNTYLMMDDIFKSLIGLGKDFKCPVWTASQTQRWKEDAVGEEVGELVTKSNVADSWRKVTAADIIVTLSQTPYEKKNHELRLLLDGARRCKDNVLLRCRIDYETCRVTEAENLDLIAYQEKRAAVKKGKAKEKK